mmetsp:Transcript_27561/g.51080  ORF Transcript_27561/g.51080 Transcript_27561/m.51080 type:complete len:350 (+) Transcript_27561:3582-4631(+)
MPSAFPLLKINPRIHKHIHQVGQDPDDQADQTKDKQRAKNHRIVPCHGGLKAQPAKAVEREDRLDQNRAAKEHANKHRRKTCNHNQHGVAEHVAVKHPFFCQTFGPRCHHVVLLDLIQKAVLSQQRKCRKGRDSRSQNRQGDVPEVIQHFSDHRQVFKVIRRQSAQWEDLPIGATGKQNQKHDRKQEPRNGIAHNNCARRPSIKRRAVFHSLANAQRYGHEISNERRPKSQRYRHRHFLQHQISHTDFAEIALAKIQPHIVAHHRQEAFQRRLIKAKLFLQLLNELFGQATRAQVFTVRAKGLLRGHIIATACKAGEYITLPLHFGKHLLHRPTWHKLHQREVDDHDPK